jgi:hypothetical protein
MSLQKAGVIILACGLAGCAIHPIPDNVTGVKTATIVHKIRCEARDAIISARVAYVHNLYPDVDDLETLRKRLAQLKPPNKILYNLSYFGTTGIVYSFTLDGTETESASFTADVIRPLTHGLATLTPSAGNSLMRENIRTFTISDSFDTLLDPKNDNYCNAIGPSYPNYEYPIAGRVGVDEMVTTFIELTLRDALSPKQDAAGAPPNTPPPIAMVDTLNFTTSLSAGLGGKVTFTPVGKKWQLMDASLPLSAMRVDKHQVIIGLALAKPYIPFGTSPFARTAMLARWSSWASVAGAAGNNPQLIMANPVQPSESGEAIALQAVNNQILRFELPKPLVVVP